MYVKLMSRPLEIEMAAIFRVKRKISSDAAEVLLISCKKAKFEDEDQGTLSNEVEGVGKFAATVNNKVIHLVVIVLKYFVFEGRLFGPLCSKSNQTGKVEERI